MDELEAVRCQIRKLEGIAVRERTDAENNLLAGYLAERARLSGNYCVVFIMLLLSGDFISSSV